MNTLKEQGFATSENGKESRDQSQAGTIDLSQDQKVEPANQPVGTQSTPLDTAISTVLRNIPQQVANNGTLAPPFNNNDGGIPAPLFKPSDRPPVTKDRPDAKS